MAADPGSDLHPPMDDVEATEPVSLPELRSIVEADTTYSALKRHFCMTGKGRRPDLPLVTTLSHMLLLQLYFVKEDGQYSYADLKAWLLKLLPSTSTVTESRICHRIQTILKSCTTELTQCQVKSFLAQEYCFDALAAPLAALGLTRQHLIREVNFETSSSHLIYNSVVHALEVFRSRENMAQNFVHKWLCVLSPPCPFSEKQLRTKVKGLMTTFRKMKGKDLEEFLKLPFYESGVTNSNASQSQTCSCQPENTKLIKCVEKLKCDLEKVRSENAKLCSDVILLVDEKKDMMATIRNQELLLAEITTLNKHNTSTLENTNIELSRQLQIINQFKSSKTKTYKINCALRKKIETANISHQTQLNILNSSIRQKDKSIQKLEKEIHALEEKVNAIRKKCYNRQTVQTKLAKKFKKTSQVLNAMINIEAEEKENIELREGSKGRPFCENIRLAYMDLQGEAYVSAENCSKVVNIVAKHVFNVNINPDNLPKSSSAVNFQDEAHVLAKHHAAHELQNCKHFTFATDGTSRDKKHYIEQHVMLDSGKTICLGFSEVASDDSDTLLEKTVEIFHEISELYGGREERDKVMKDIITKLKALMSDRAAVMKCFDSKLAKYKETLLNGVDCSTHFLFCSAHFLLGLSSAADEAIKVIEQEEHSKLGRDAQAQFSRFQFSSESAALRLIRTAAEVLGPRGDEKSGVRQEWLVFCSSKGIKSIFTTFRTNRFNNIFQNASAVTKHHNDILQFLTENSSCSNMKLQSVISDLQDERILAMVAALSLFHIFFTEPYWQLMNSKKTYGDFPQYVRKMEDRLNEWESETVNVNIQHLTSVFDDFKVESPHISNFFASEACNADCVKQKFIVLSRHCNIVFKRQLSDFLDGGVFGGVLDDEVVSTLKACPLTNLTGERLFGDLDYDIGRRRNASLHVRSSKIMWKRNQTSQWLNRQPHIMKKKLIKKAIQCAPKIRKISRLSVKAVRDKIEQKIKEIKRKKLEKEVNLDEKKSAIMDKIIAQGGICTTKEGVVDLMTKPNALENIKAQINYRRVCRGEKIHVTGPLGVLYRRLIQHLGEDIDESDPIPIGKKRKLSK